MSMKPRDNAVADSGRTIEPANDARTLGELDQRHYVWHFLGELRIERMIDPYPRVNDTATGGDLVARET